MALKCSIVLDDTCAESILQCVVKVWGWWKRRPGKAQCSGNYRQWPEWRSEKRNLFSNKRVWYSFIWWKYIGMIKDFPILQKEAENVSRLQLPNMWSKNTILRVELDNKSILSLQRVCIQIPFIFCFQPILVWRQRSINSDTGGDVPCNHDFVETYLLNRFLLGGKRRW